MLAAKCRQSQEAETEQKSGAGLRDRGNFSGEPHVVEVDLAIRTGEQSIYEADVRWKRERVVFRENRIAPGAPSAGSTPRSRPTRVIDSSKKVKSMLSTSKPSAK